VAGVGFKWVLVEARGPGGELIYFGYRSGCRGLGFGVWGLGFGVWGLGFRV
jgi:hypothetical protein